MCLKIDSNQSAIIAEKDIKCVKLLTSLFNGGYKTPYTQSSVVFGTVMKERRFEHHVFGRTSANEVHLGFHTFKDRESAIRYCKSNFIFGVLVKAIIPKGTLFYEGEVNNSGIKGYTSQSIIYIKPFKWKWLQRWAMKYW